MQISANRALFGGDKYICYSAINALLFCAIIDAHWREKLHQRSSRWHFFTHINHSFEMVCYSKAFVISSKIFCREIFVCFRWCRLFAEDRPYWWIQETEVYSDLTRPNFRQTHLTCETSAGNPSGHVMFTAAIFYVGMTNILYTTNWYRRSGVITKYCIWNIFVAALALVTVSRVYFAAHFLHQCIFGAGLGVLIGYWLQRPDIHRRLTEMSMKKSFSLWIAMLLLATIVFCGHFLLDKDPHWSIRKV